MGIDDIVQPRDMIKEVTGRVVTSPSYAGEIPAFDITEPEEVDRVFLLVTKMDRGYGNLHHHYRGCIDRVTMAYRNKDLVGFNRAVKCLLTEIQSN